MPKSNQFVSDIYIRLNGADLEPPAINQVTEVTVDQHVHLPGLFTIRLYDPDLTLLDTGHFDPATPIEIWARDAQDRPVSLIKGEITAIAPEFGEGMIAELVVRGYDQSHRLYREVKSKTYLNVKDSDLATQFAQKAGLDPLVEATPTVYDHLYQHNLSDLQFLMQRAWRIGYECYVDGDKLIFRKPAPANAPAPLTLAWGEDLLSFHPQMTLAEQVEEVEVKGWDVQKKAPIAGKATSGALYPNIQEKQQGDAWSKKLPIAAKMVIVDQPPVSQAEALILAQARLNEISGVFIEAEGVAFRRPEIKAGQRLKLTGLGKRFSGAYLITSATHHYSHAGFKTTFSVRGARTGLLIDQIGHADRLHRWPGVVPAIVTNNDDPSGWGRVKVKFPWMSDKEESDWARVLGVGAGGKAGFCSVPAVQNEVLVTFVHGDFGCPVVLGGLWNGQDALPAQVADAPEGEKAQVRSWHTPKGHRLTLYDNSDNKIEMVTAGGHQLTLDEAGKKVAVVTQGGHKLTLDDQGRKIELNSTGGLMVTLDDNALQVTVMSPTNVTVQAGATLTLQAATLALVATTLSLSAASLAMSGTGNIDLSTTGAVSIKGATVALN
ncbi:MAG: hypothetical protein DYG89_22525 [Caldilinea sp. CFX5]|nr:hypothetical protein [Caldilinea sp. CFX5]